jgi:uncharacterized repeat protein (TIGR04076 family)
MANSTELSKCKITVLKRTINQDLIDNYLDDAYKHIGPCESLREGQEFVIEGDEQFSVVPDGFCAWAWADIRRDILTVAVGGDLPGLRHRGTVITGCTDWYRPVIFKVERMDNA